MLMSNGILEDLGRTTQKLVQHELDVITESEWFEDLVQKKLEAIIDKCIT
jgi:hypothetical protein